MIYPNIETEMKRHGINNNGPAKEIRIPEEELIRKLNGEEEFTLDEIERIAAVFNCSPDYMIGHEVKRNTYKDNDIAVQS